MGRLAIEDMIKALKCVASQNTAGDCYADYENFRHMDDNKYKRLVCRNGENLKDYISGRDAVGCPYYQREYGCCFDDGELFWLEDVAKLLEELKFYKEAGLCNRKGIMVKEDDTCEKWKSKNSPDWRTRMLNTFLAGH